MAKKALQLASVASMIDQFNIPNIEILQSLGYSVDVVADFTNPGTITKERAENLRKRLDEMGVRVFDIEIPRSLSPKAVVLAYHKIKALIRTEHYEIVHCHSPIGGAITRYAARKERISGTKVIYTAHGFHFYDGSPLINWVFFYPIEKWLSKYTDILITINKEDFNRAKRSFHAKETIYIQGIGVDTSKFIRTYSGRNRIRNELGIAERSTVLLSVGELNDNKNHEIIIRALINMKKNHRLPSGLVYIIVGKGKNESKLKKAIMKYKLEEEVKLVGFRTDVSDFYSAADLFVFPSFREGLSVSLMEAMACELPIVCSRIRGNTDLLDENKGGFFFNPKNVDSVSNAIDKTMKENMRKLGSYNKRKVKAFDINNVNKSMIKIYMDTVKKHSDIQR